MCGFRKDPLIDRMRTDEYAAESFRADGGFEATDSGELWLPIFAARFVGMGSVERTRELRRRRSRKVKLAKIRARYNTVTSEADKAQLLAKAQRVSPLVTEADLAPTVATAS